MTDEERLFALAQCCVTDAVTALEYDTPLVPFAKLLSTDGDYRDIYTEDQNEANCYENLVMRLRAEVLMDDIEAVSVTARVTIPEHLSASSPQGIRIHLEEKAKIHAKLSARLLYIPYELLSIEGESKRHVMLHTPLCVGIPMQIYAP